VKLQEKLFKPHWAGWLC